MTSRVVFIVLAGGLLLTGCGTAPLAERDTSLAGRVKLLEAQNREQQQSILKLGAELQAYRADRDELRKMIAKPPAVPTPVEGGFRFEVAKVELGLLTCAIDTDGKKGDDAVAAFVNLKDQFDSSLKAAGTFRLDLFDLARSEDHVIRTWTFTPEQAASLWQNFPGAYQFKLPFGEPLATTRVTLKVTFTQPGKTPLTATREVRIELP